MATRARIALCQDESVLRALRSARLRVVETLETIDASFSIGGDSVTFDAQGKAQRLPFVRTRNQIDRAIAIMEKKRRQA